MNKNFHFGIIIPASNITVEKELFSIINQNDKKHMKLFFHFGRAGFNTRYKVSAKKYLSEVVSNLPNEIKKISKIDVENISFFCTSGSLLLNNYSDIKDECTKILNKELITPIESLINAYNLLHIRYPLVITPYQANISSQLSKVMLNNGIFAKKVVSLNLNTTSQLYEYSYNKLFTLLEKELLNKNKYDGICIMCTNFPTFNLIEKIENKFGIPTISSNQATLFEILKQSSADINIYNLGKLFNKL